MSLSPITSGAVTTFLTMFPGLGFAFTASGFFLSGSSGGPGISRGIYLHTIYIPHVINNLSLGLIFIPETGVSAEAYAPLARDLAKRGHYAFVLSNTNGKEESAIISDVYEAMKVRPHHRPL